MFEKFPPLGYTGFQRGINLPNVGRAPLSKVFSPKLDEIGFSEISVGLEDNGASYYIRQCSSQPSPEGFHTSE